MTLAPVPRLSGLSARRPGLALGVVGAAGLGKTHTLREWTRTLPFAHLGLPARQLGTLGEKLPPGKREAAWVAAKLDACAQAAAPPDPLALGARLAAHAPFVLVLEDLHELGEAERAGLSALADVVRRGRGVGLLVSSRAPLPPGFGTLTLSPLEPGECAELLRAQLGAALPTDAADWIYSRTAGNPLFTLEYLRHVSVTGALWSDGTRWHWREPPSQARPDTVEALIWEALGQPGAAARREILEARAYLETRLGALEEVELWVDWLSGTADDVCLEARTLEALGLLSAGTFVHPLYREVLFAALSGPRRAALAERLLSGQGPRRLSAAGRAELLGDVTWPPAEELRALLSVLAEAGDGTEPHAPLLMRAAELAQGQQRGELALRAARAHEADADAFTHLAELAAAHLADPSEALLLLAAHQARDGQPDRMSATLARLPAPVRASDRWPALEVKLLFDSGQPGAVLERWQARPGWAQSCPPATAYYVAYVLLDSGDHGGARALALEVLARLGAGDPGRAELDDILAALAFYEGRYAEADGLFGRVADTYRRVGDTAGLANALRNRAVVRLQFAGHRQSLAGFAEAAALYARQGSAVALAQTQIMACDAHLELGDFAAVDDLLRAALAVLEAVPPQPFLAEGLAKRVALYLAWQPPHGAALALRAARQAVEVAAGLSAPTQRTLAALSLSQALTFAGQAQDGLARAEEGSRLAAELGNPEAEVSAHWARAQALEALGQRAEATAAYGAAHAGAQTAQLALETQLLGLELARLGGDTAGVRQRLEWFTAGGFGKGAARAGAILAALDGGGLQVTEDRTELRLEALGPLQLAAPGAARSGAAQPVRGELRRSLFVLLLEARVAGRAGVGRLELIDALYPGQDEAAALTNLKAAVFKARAAHGDAAILTAPDGYALGGGRSDAEEFLAGGDTRLWRGPPALNPVSEAADALNLALLARIRPLLGSDPGSDSREAARLCALLCEADPYALEALGLRCQALERLGQRRTLKRLYGKARAVFAQIGEELPEQWTALLH